MSKFFRSKSRTGTAGLIVLCGLLNLAATGLRPSAGERAFAGMRLYQPNAQERAKWRLEEAEQELAMDGGRFHKQLNLFVHFPGVQLPELLDGRSVDLPDSTSVVGVDVNGRACAFPLDAMKDPALHIVNLVIDQRAISVSYCDLVDRVRVLTGDSFQAPIKLDVGGLDIDNQLVFLFQGERYGQDSCDLPLADYPFTRSTLGEWKQRYPDTRVCIPSDRETHAIE